MKKQLLSFFIACCYCMAAMAQDSAAFNQRMQWWRDARFGMFIHWGVYAVPAGEFRGHKIEHIGEWIMNRGKIPVQEYKRFAESFNPVLYDPEAWVKAAKDAGMKYIVITAKHHDGFAMFDSKASDW
ncbi:MAG TPA: alpha-L-fucosidase, partial [Chitinophagaceae bacterium]|nr:alpha-L-fucosidase [Chitinophagaceae bacterium]